MWRLSALRLVQVWKDATIITDDGRRVQEHSCAKCQN